MPIDTSDMKAPPRKSPGRPSNATKTAQAQAAVEYKRAKYEEVLSGFAVIGVMVTTALGQYANAGAISKHAPVMVPVYAKTATEVEWFGRGLDFLIGTGPWMEAGTVTLPFAAQLLVNAGRMQPSPTLGTVHREVLEAEVLSSLAAQAEAARDARADAEARLRSLNGQTAETAGVPVG